MKTLLFCVLLSLCSVSSFANLVKNADWSQISPMGIPRFWDYRSPDTAALSVHDGVATFDLVKGGENQFFIQRNLALQPGKTYTVSYEVKSDSNAQYRLYYEVVFKDPKRDSDHTATLKAGKDWQKITFQVKDRGEKSYDHLVINPKSGKDISFRNLTMTETTAAATAAGTLAILGGQATVNGNNKIIDIAENPAFAISFVSNYIPGASIKKVPVTPGKTYTLSFKVKGDAIENPHYQGFVVEVDLNVTNIQEIIKSPADDVWSNGYQSKTFTFSVPSDYPHKTVNLNLSATAGSKVIFTQLALAQIDRKPEDNTKLHVTSPAYRKSFFASIPNDTLAGYIVGEKDSATAEISFMQGEKVLKSAKAPFVDGKAQFSFSCPDLNTGKYLLQVEVLDKNNKNLVTLSEEINKYPPNKVEVVADQQKNFHINGKLFMPIFYWVLVDGKYTLPEEMLHYVASKGGNVVMVTSTNADQMLQYLDLAKKYGVKLVLRSTFPPKDDPETVKQWLQGVYNNILTPEIMEHEALFGYLLCDEPSWLGRPLKNLIAGYQGIKKLDPYHPIWINAAPRGALEEHMAYSQAADIYGVDIYPVGSTTHSGLDDKNITCLGKYAQRMADSVNGLKPNWTCLQGFAWGEISANKKNLIYPDKVESRFMVYDTFLNEGNAVGYYGFNHNLNPEFLDMIGEVTLELHSMSALLLEGKVLQDIKTPEYAARIFDYNGKKYMIAINYLNKEQSIQLPGAFTAESLNVFQENRKVAVKQGSITDNFAPYAVHIYGEAALPKPLTDIPSFNGENPWKKHLAYQKSLEKYSYKGKGNWIWDQAMQQEAVTGLVFQLKKPVKSALLKFCADNSAEVFVNGIEVGKNTLWYTMTSVEVGSMLKQGENRILAKLNDDGNGLFGFLADLEISYEDGSSEYICTDDSWKGTQKQDATDIEQWKPVKIVAPYGQNRWGKEVKTK